MNRLLRFVFLAVIIMAFSSCTRDKDPQKATPRNDEVAHDNAANEDNLLPANAKGHPEDGTLEETFNGAIAAPEHDAVDADDNGADEKDASEKDAAGNHSASDDKTPAKNTFDITLQKGQYVYIHMRATTPFRTYLIVQPPEGTSNYQNAECLPGRGLESCVRFQATQTGAYTITGRAYRPGGHGTFTITVYKETDAQAVKNAKQHKLDAKKSYDQLKAFQKKKKEESARKIQAVINKIKAIKNEQNATKEDDDHVQTPPANTPSSDNNSAPDAQGTDTEKAAPTTDNAAVDKKPSTAADEK